MKTTPLLLTALLLGCTPADPPAAAPPGAEYACVGEGTIQYDGEVWRWIGESLDAQGRLVEEVHWRDAERTQLEMRRTWRYEGELLAELRGTWVSAIGTPEPNVHMLQYLYNDMEQLIRIEGRREGSDTLESLDTFTYDEDGNEIEWTYWEQGFRENHLRRVKVWQDGRLQHANTYWNDEPTPSARLVRSYVEPPPGLDYLETTEDLIDGDNSWREVTHDPAGRIQRRTTGLPGADATSWRDFVWDEAGRPLEEDYLSEILDTSQTQRWRYDERGLLVEYRKITDSIDPGPQRTESVRRLDWVCR